MAAALHEAVNGSSVMRMLDVIFLVPSSGVIQYLHLLKTASLHADAYALLVGWCRFLYPK
jgi:hypothetical protein